MACHPHAGYLPAAMPRLESKGDKLMRRTIQTRPPVRTRTVAPVPTPKRQKTQLAPTRTTPLFATPSAVLLQSCITAVASEQPEHTPAKDPQQLRQTPVGPELQGQQPKVEQPGSSSSKGVRQRRRGSVRFGAVQVLTHAAQLDESKLPSDGAAPLGLGQLLSTEEVLIDSYEEHKGSQCRGATIVPVEERHATLSATSCFAMLERVERENCALKRALNESLREHVHSIATADNLARFATNMGVQAMDGVVPVGVKLVRERRPRQVAE